MSTLSRYGRSIKKPVKYEPVVKRCRDDDSCDETIVSDEHVDIIVSRLLKDRIGLSNKGKAKDFSLIETTILLHMPEFGYDTDDYDAVQDIVGSYIQAAEDAVEDSHADEDNEHERLSDEESCSDQSQSFAPSSDVSSESSSSSSDYESSESII
jgi:hypothetical protein